ncbi:monooxygenase [Nocardioides psychrotolerans]|uniref:Acyl-CoA dehydrogenase n=1 Tax=Nocardioides psychrotolerans TaxID=1005945 RepID=A0A1I3H766_9ACTN|nr:monooxygenase [Nocardioides psychrotolerans]GEP37719.1 monooxygenase [Nocardioides psychrotolerans]SFI31585.1 Acyl-CoA dehydrogenase [Nocardioides psychrotolerans]
MTVYATPSEVLTTWGSNPRSPEAWVERDRANQTPYAEVQLLKDAGQDWTTALRVVRAVSAGDGSIGQLLGYHYLWAWAARLVGTSEQVESVEQQATEGTWFFGGAVNPRDDDLSIREEGGELVFTGRKSFSTGGRVSDVTVLEGVIEGTEKHVFDRVFVPRVYNTLNVPLIQLIFANLYLGIAEGALATAATYTRDKTRAWPYTPDLKQRGSEEFYVLEAYGDLRSKLWAAEALAERGAELIEGINEHADTVTGQERGEAAVVIAAAKQVAIGVGLEIGTRVFDVTGARATASSVGLDISWRNIRTHSLHDPIAHKRAEVGRYALLGELPEPTWYT